jgi:hypothetical protein
MSSRALRASCAAVGGSVPHAVSPPRVFDVFGDVCACCVCAFLRARAQLRHGRRWLRKHGEQHVSPPHHDEAYCRLFCGGVNAVAGTQGVRALSSVGRSLTQCRRHECSTSASASASSYVRACLRALAQLHHGRRWLRQHGEQHVSLSLPHPDEACCRLFCGGVNVVAGTQGVRALPSVGRSLTQCRHHACLTSVGASASAYVRACVRGRGRSYTTVAGGQSNVASGG